MNASRNLLAVIGAFSVCVNSMSQNPEPRPVVQALPRAEVLGSGWRREISLLFDPASNPAEIVSATAQLPGSRRKEHRDAVANPTNQISGWSHAHFDFQGTNRSCRYEVQVERYRSKEALIESFGQLLALRAEQYQKIEVQGIGEAAVMYRDRSGVTLWLRRGDFKVSISPMCQTSSWEGDSALQLLAKALVQRLDESVGTKKEQK